MTAFDKARGKLAALVIVALCLLARCPCLLASNPSLDLSQYAHTAWRVRDGFTQGFIRTIAQTPDGYIWLGTGFGLFRFDGVHAEPWQPPLNGEQLPSNFIVCLRVARDGTFWIGTREGLASWRDGKLTRYPDLAGSLIASIFEDRKGTVWIGSSSMASPGKLCAIDTADGACHESGPALPRGVSFLYQDSHGVLWVVAPDGVWRWRPGPPKFYRMPFGTAVAPDLCEDSDGTLLIPMPGELDQFRGGGWGVQHPYLAPEHSINGTRVLRDRDGGLWIGTAGAGVVHLHDGRTDVFSQADGLSGDLVTSLFEDREGNVWVATLGGLDRFRNYAVATYAEHEGFATIPGRGSVVEGRDGSIWIGSNDGLRVWKHGDLRYYGTSKAEGSMTREIWLPVHYVGSSGMGDGVSVSVFSDNAGRVLVSTPYSFGEMERDRFVPFRGVPGGVVTSVAQDRQGDLWIANEAQGLVRLLKDGTVRRILWADIGHRDGAQSLAADRVTGGLWLGFDEGGVAHFKDGRIRETYSQAEGLGSGRVSGLYADQDGAVWAGTEAGVSRIKDGRVLTMRMRNGLPCEAVHWITQDVNHSLWLNTTCGLLHIGHDELNAWAADSRRKIQLSVFDNADGVSNAPIGLQVGTQAVWASDGKLWFEEYSGGVSVIDPTHLPINGTPPPVDIERVTANGKVYDASRGMRLPPRIHDLKLEYAALSFVAPEKVRFRYQLAGLDRGAWELTSDRQVQYSNLPPGSYHFHVVASNNSGVWNETGASLDFSIEPAYYQTVWFRLCCTLAFILLLAAMYLLRIRQLQAQFAANLDARVDERTRIARDLHDTLLQSFLALMFQFQAVRNMVPRKPEEAVQALDEAVAATSKAITESREAISDLRPDPVTQRDLPEVLRAAGQEFSMTESANGYGAIFRVTVEGTPQTIPARVQNELHRIAREAIRNAFRHAHASHIEAVVHYDRDQLTLRIRDDGNGIPPKILSDGGCPGHWGISGILERAKRIGSRLEFSSREGVGTVVELRLPAEIAYAPRRSKFRLFRRDARYGQHL